MRFLPSAITVMVTLGCSKPKTPELDTHIPQEKSTQISKATDDKIFTAFALVVKPSVKITSVDGAESKILRKGDLLHIKRASEKDIEVVFSHFDAMVPLHSVSLLKPTNEYDANAVEMSAIQAAAFIYDLEIQIGRKFLGKPTERSLCLKHFEQGYPTEAAKKFADNSCEPYGGVMTGSDRFFDGPVQRIKLKKIYDVETIDLCIETWETTGVETSINTLKKHGPIWKIEKGVATKC